MADPVLAEKSFETIIAEVLARFKAEMEAQGLNGTLAQGDPRRLLLLTVVLILVQQRALIDYSGKQSLLRFVGDDWIDELAALWGERRRSAEPSSTTERFTYATSGAHTVPAGVRVTDGANIWAVTEDTSANGLFVDAEVECITAGKATNGVIVGLIDTLVDPDDVPGVVSVSNTTETSGGKDTESLEEFRERLRDVPESRSTCGPRVAYEAAALEVSPTVADAVALGPDDASDVASYAPGDGEVIVLVIKGERDGDGALTSVEPDPDVGLLTDVEEALSAEDVRPLTDHVTVQAPLFVDFDATVTYYIARSRSKSASEIQVAVEDAFNAYLLWQQSKIGRDINPSELTARLLNAGAKRVAISSPSFQALLRDQCARASYTALVYAGVEDD